MEINKITHIIQITDTHLFANKEGELLQLNTYESLSAVLKLLEQEIDLKKVDLMIFTGDLTQDASLQSYQHLLNFLKQYQCNISWILGNHDELATSNQALQNSFLKSQRHFIFGNWQIILLDSHQDGHVAGFLDENELHFLDQTLKTHPQHALIFLHHHVLPLDTHWLDKLNLHNSHQFLEIIDRHNQVSVVGCGHVHQASEKSRNNVKYISTPSTSIQFKPNSDRFALDTQMPGFRSIQLLPDGKIETKVIRIPYNEKFIPNLNSPGY